MLLKSKSNSNLIKMKHLLVLSLLFLTNLAMLTAQQKTDNKKEIINLIKQYSDCVIERDSVKFYKLFNEGEVTWCASLKDRSQAREIEMKGVKSARNSYFSSSYTAFMRGLFHYQSTEDKFDNITIIEDGTVASITMDYSFWADNKMTNFGGKYLTLIKRNGQWKITSVIYSLELTVYFTQPSVKDREKEKKRRL